jgi:hypothetical protein
MNKNNMGNEEITCMYDEAKNYRRRAKGKEDENIP